MEEEHVFESLDLRLDSKLVYTRLTERVRKHYFSYLERVIKENIYVCCGLKASKNEIQEYANSCAKELENEALQKCMVLQLYQAAMVNTIGRVRNSTKDSRVEKYLQILISNCKNKDPNKIFGKNEMVNQATQTDHQYMDVEKAQTSGEEVSSFTLQQKIDMFHQRFNETAVTEHSTHNVRYRKRKRTLNKVLWEDASQSPNKYQTSKSPTPLLVDPIESKHPNIQEDDKIAIELAKLFSEEKTELDEIFGIDPNAQTDDPQIKHILKEIENSKLSCEQETPKCSKSILNTTHSVDNKSLTHNMNRNSTQAIIKPESSPKIKPKSPNLSKSIWPCELYMQRRRLLASLSRLIEEDMRWQELMKWRFTKLFGEDSDDEFEVFSPSIELDDVLIGSCVQRISPWMVKHLMKPMREGLIGNRYLFKALAKHLAHTIVLVNQYPDEQVIKDAVEEFFCTHQSVLCNDDLTVLPIFNASNEHPHRVAYFYN